MTQREYEEYMDYVYSDEYVQKCHDDSIRNYNGKMFQLKQSYFWLSETEINWFIEEGYIKL